ncbi:uncharacterized protein SAPINGB_P001614 [Magnusiomyces paraingens]|uniref:SH3 domain-containing protein n=1 Tax=Magnusiomyces paraingens TaxID=2606893 RepID=A0A5E8B782_9ASCO|nr:uncharacterized protein SAPINGB_P001614 [Saprochaete ingens]VVT47243.1 unnamed protein product [Saprochaete ingens]
MSNVPVFSINRSLNNVLSELEFLRETQVITPELYNQIVNKIPRTYEQGVPPVGPFELASGSTANIPSYQNTNTPNTITTTTAATNPSSNTARSDEKQVLTSQQAPPQQQQQQQPQLTGGEVVEALYAYQPAAPTDLPLYPGQRINIVEKLNADWWRGRDTQTGQEGIFPANYVRVSQQQQAPPPQQQPQQQQGYQAYDNRGGYGAPPPSYGATSYQYAQPPPQQQQQQQQQFPPPSVNYYQPPPQQQQQPQQIVVQEQQPQQQQQQQQHHQSSAVADGAKKFGSKLGNAAIFGAGATIGSNIVNSIF